MVSVKELLGLQKKYGDGGRDDTVYQFPADAEVDTSLYVEILPEGGKRRGRFRFFHRRPMTDTRAGHTAQPYENLDDV